MAPLLPEATSIPMQAELKGVLKENLLVGYIDAVRVPKYDFLMVTVEAL